MSAPACRCQFTSERVATGEGHYLGEAQTLARMRTEYVYSRLGDRRDVGDRIHVAGMTGLNDYLAR